MNAGTAAPLEDGGVLPVDIGACIADGTGEKSSDLAVGDISSLPIENTEFDIRRV